MANQEEYVDLSSVSVEKYVTNNKQICAWYIFAKSEAKCIFYFAKKSENPFNFVKFF